MPTKTNLKETYASYKHCLYILVKTLLITQSIIYPNHVIDHHPIWSKQKEEIKKTFHKLAKATQGEGWGGSSAPHSLLEHHTSSVMNCIHASSLSSSSLTHDDDPIGTSGDMVSYWSLVIACGLSISTMLLHCPWSSTSAHATFFLKTLHSAYESC